MCLFENEEWPKYKVHGWPHFQTSYNYILLYSLGHAFPLYSIWQDLIDFGSILGSSIWKKKHFQTWLKEQIRTKMKFVIGELEIDESMFWTGQQGLVTQIQLVLVNKP